LKYLIAGLGNIGEKYQNTRHNIGFLILDSLARESNISFEEDRLAYKATYKYKSRTFILIKPTTFMNLSGKAINYWLQKESIDVQNLLVLVDDLALPFGTIRIRQKGGDGGHNGLIDIAQTIGSNDFSRMRFGIGNEFNKGSQVNYVLGEMTPEENKILSEKFEYCKNIIHSFGTIGIERTMNFYNKK